MEEVAPATAPGDSAGRLKFAQILRGHRPHLPQPLLMQQLALDIRKVAVEQNLAIVPRSAYSATPIMDGDRIEIVGFIGGG